MAAPTDASRLAARARPSGVPAGFQEWRRLLFLHWPVRAAVLRPLVPAPLELDLWDGWAYLSLVPFWVQAARPVGAPRALGLRFLETNVRTYVHLGGQAPGVYFFSLDAASVLAVVGARLGLGLAYFVARGRERHSPTEVDYRLRRVAPGRPGCGVRYRLGESVPSAAPGTLDFFLVERYVLHARRGPSVWSVRIHHAPYPLRRVVALDGYEDRLMAADGLPEPDAPPALMHFSPGVDVAIFPPTVRLAR
jgi:uncharacterized protein YqjF (DUF2071 family)